jgi:hypothetical protein
MYKLPQIQSSKKMELKLVGQDIDTYCQPCSSSKDSDDTWTHTDTDISSEATEVQAVANAVWTDTVKANYKTFVESQGI